MKQAFFADDAPKPGGRYSHAVRAGDTVYLAGQVPQDPETGEQPDGFEAQARQAFRNLEAAARAAGASLADAVRVGVYLTDMSDFAAMNMVFAEFSKPASEMVALLTKQGVLTNPAGGPRTLRLVTHLDVSAADIDEAVARIRRTVA